MQIGGNCGSGPPGRIEENLLAPGIELALDVVLVCSMGAFHMPDSFSTQWLSGSLVSTITIVLMNEL